MQTHAQADENVRKMHAMGAARDAIPSKIAETWKQQAKLLYVVKVFQDFG